MATKFYKCNHCGNVVIKVVDSNVPVVCCGEEMSELIPNTVDASGEKHVPVVTRIDEKTIKVNVGSVAHPMLEEHHIAFVYVETENGGIMVNLKDKPEAIVYVGEEKVVTSVPVISVISRTSTSSETSVRFNSKIRLFPVSHR